MIKFFKLALLTILISNPSYSKTSMLHHLPSFPFQQGWMGSDLAYSIDLQNGKFLWLFGDTYIAKPGATNRDGAQRVTNSIGVSYIDENNQYQIDYYWRDMHKEKPQAIFPHEREHEGYLYWPKDAIVINDQLLVALVEIHVFDITSPMGFKETGTRLAYVDNYLATPDKWNYKIIDFSPHSNIYPGTRFILQGDFLYWYSTFKEQSENIGLLSLIDLPIVLQRVSISNISNLKEYQQYYSHQNTWESGFDINKAKFIMQHASTEMTVHYSEALSKWVAVYGHFAIFSDEVHLRTADQLEGPWSEPKVIFRFPEMDPKNRLFLEGGFGYAAKFHPQFTEAKDSKVVMTYVVNNLKEARLKNQLNAYVPQVVVIDLLAPDLN